jgi:hypothetical protein
MSYLKTCNVTINGQQYYSDLPNQGLRVIGNIATIAWSFTMFTSCLCCFVCMLILALILQVSGASPVIVLVLSICCCLSSTYYYYGYSSAKSDLEKVSTDVINNKTSRPCKDPTNGVEIK